MESLLEIYISLIALTSTFPFSDSIILNAGNLQVPSVMLNSRHTNSSVDHNKTIYYLSRDEAKNIVLTCQSKKPNRWVWSAVDDVVESVEVEKKRKDVHGNTTYESSLAIHFYDFNDEVQANFSCTNEIEKKGGSGLVTCVIVNQIIKDKLLSLGPVQLIVSQRVPLENCTTIGNKVTRLDCPIKVTVDTAQLRGICNENGVLKSVSCHDLDHCNSLIYLKAENDTCKGNYENFTGISSNSKALIGGNFPEIAHCKLPFLDSESWLSFLLLYPTFGETEITKFRYYSNMAEALGHNSIQLFALPGESIAEENHSFTFAGRHQFADEENVEFICKAVSFLYMKGFRLRVGTTTDKIESGGRVVAGQAHHTVKKNEHFYIVQQNITLSTKEYGHMSWISCDGPIWNSREWFSAILNISVYPSEEPTVKLTKEDSRDFITFICTYGGWPRPTVTWDVDPPNSIKFTNQTGHIPNVEEYNTSWSQIRVISKRNTGLKSVTCTVKNFRESRNSSINDLFSSNEVTSNERVVYIVVTCSVGILVIVLFLVTLFYWRYRKKLELYSQTQLTELDIQEFYNGATENTADYEALYLPYNNDYEIKEHELILDGSILGSGQFGIVLKGRIGDLPVAVKTIKPTTDIIYFKSLLSELKILQFVGAHRNIVNLVGANTSNIRKREVFLVLDYCSNGSLVSFLRQCRDRFVDFFGNCYSTQSDSKKWPLYENSKEITITTLNLLIFSYEIASAMDHLARKNVIHGDLAARNVLVTDDLHAKVCDFGLAKQLLHYSVYVQKIDCPLPLRWMAIESLQDMEFSLASDRWSYGVCLWEIFSLAEIPYPGEQWSFASYKMLQEGYRMAKPTNANDSIYNLMLKCWEAQPQDRPTFQYIIKELRKEEERLT